jgi:hypothetical protein
LGRAYQFRRDWVGTSIHFSEMSAAGIPASILSAGDTFWLEFPNNNRTGGEVLEREGDQITIRLKNNSVWTMTPHATEDDPVGIQSAVDVHSQDWVVREAGG